MAQKVRTSELPPHPIEASQAFKAYVDRSSLTNRGSLLRAMTRFLREMAPVQVKDLTALHLEQVFQRLTAQGYNKSYIDKLYRRFAGFLSWCRDMGYAESNQARMARPAAPDALFIPVLIPDNDIRTLHQFIMERGIVEEIILWGALRMGARLSEPCTATVGSALRDREVAEFMADPRVRFETKTSPRLARQPRFALQAYKALLEKKKHDPEAPLLYLDGVPLYDKRGEKNIEARCIIARNWFKRVQEQALGEYRYTPKAMRSNFISRELQDDPDKLLAVAQQCGNSIRVIQSNYLSFLQTPEFSTGEDIF